MFMKLEKSGEMVFGLLAGDMFLDGECESWSEGAGVFLWEPFGKDPAIVVFENNGSYKCYKVQEKVDFKEIILSEK
ncbi:hypothetical protein M3172_23400 [Mesobacillus subterraneus]|jgi:hypothetical protein|uniref:hypothetical protein n=1 Tax=Mesobacillus subterraneus TaxID=285983 RepID=UPI00203A9D00|nr:hypothetical protein [Mesobacillus subterraneus]MCM3576121.1 hypothetical protein [Mesobacillus subterraneus]